MSLRIELLAIFPDPESAADELDALLNWFDTNAERIAWNHDRAEDLQAMVAVLREDIE